MGFLGAGVIFRSGATVKGLTTAAGIWATSAVGMAIGSGMYAVGLFTAVVLSLIHIYHDCAGNHDHDYDHYHAGAG